MDIETARKLHSHEEQEREKGNFVEALKLAAEAKVAYLEVGAKDKFAEVLASESLIFRHLFDRTGKREYLISAKMAVQTSVELAKELGDETAMAIPVFNLAKIFELMGDNANAIKSYREAVEWLAKAPPAAHNRPAVVNDFSLHLAVAELRGGDQTARERALKAINLLETDQVEIPFTRDVWASGGYMKLAEIVNATNKAEAMEYLDKAKKIIDVNPELVLRKEQWQKLAEKLK